eukprot:gb/GEZJ01001054.1/.p2 GENE.gb/GEZJ01001054.1/~~gb/GEZJ01001054.1/.p2  ORF type:complete len:206 (+),score=25.10 gb/GEZJ01001054.1/:1771-2388(+)
MHVKEKGSREPQAAKPAPLSLLSDLVSIPPAGSREKLEDRKTPRPSGLQTPERSFVNPLYLRRISGSGVSSENESPSYRRVLSAVSNPEEKNCTKYLYRSPKALDSDSDPAELSRGVMKKLLAEAKKGGRASSPRPSNAVEVCLERNKQRQVWEDYIALTYGAYENEMNSCSFRRTDTQSAPEALPKALEPQDMDDSDVDDEFEF